MTLDSNLGSRGHLDPYMHQLTAGGSSGIRAYTGPLKQSTADQKMLLAVADDMKPGTMNSVSSAFLKRSALSPKHRLWMAFHKPILVLLVGGLLFGTGTAASLLYFTQLGNVPYLVGPVLLSVGLMFLVTGLVWMPVIKQRMEHKALTQMNYSKFTSEVSFPSISQSVDLLA
ncbi:hypothetical protein AALO_G00076850 [Alosa alosa]|uniref:Uncharacterized protein n=1 Tax=Alosa alosa TaxID=278164 RepID=A0AAV6H174_9TELE|nr:hypothetical protein AALO_G00076850 [Alosa alosa]